MRYRIVTVEVVMVVIRFGRCALSLFFIVSVVFVLAGANSARAAEPIRIAMITARTGEAGKSNFVFL